MIRLQEVGMASVFIDSCQDVFNLMSLLQTFMPLARLALSRSGITDGTQCLPLGQLDWGSLWHDHVVAFQSAEWRGVSSGYVVQRGYVVLAGAMTLPAPIYPKQSQAIRIGWSRLFFCWELMSTRAGSQELSLQYWSCFPGNFLASVFAKYFARQ